MFSNAKKILVISAHGDDLEIGCGGTVHKLAKQGKEIFSLILSVNLKGKSSAFKREDVIAEIHKSGAILGIPKDHIFIENFENRVFPENRQKILDALWDHKRKINPDVVFTAALDDMHQDHVTVAEESFRAFKDQNLISYGFDWNRLEKGVDFYSVISEEDLKKKIEAALSYKSQATDRPYFSEEYIRSWAIARGVEIKERYAEAFQNIRLISR